MNREEKYIARLMFENKVLKANGQVFENLFTEMMTYSRPEFVQIKPYGNIGDRGNDGYERSFGRYFQIYAPENPTYKNTIAKAVDKLTEDFEEKLLPHWGKFCELKEFHFVFNDKRTGSNFNIEEALTNLAEKHNIQAKAFLYRDLEDEFFKLTDEQIEAVVGFLPPPSSIGINIDYSILGDVIEHILSTPASNAQAGKYVVPDPDEKIRFNRLTKQPAAYLSYASFQVGIIDDYLSKSSEFTKQDLREVLSGFYQNGLSVYANTDKNTKSDLIFFYILEQVIPEINTKIRPYHEAGLIIMANYFAACDIFENPTI
ncbi:ABC-three component system protein [Candidatus Albibeggiatoa sp. nov. BB20]|uniref:ABC-three component system protein n=1 Tax=Candidatus Albibeggiatoa sp. nov. BB20 TaxID=3162723 RepID=UPI00336573C8